MVTSKFSVSPGLVAESSDIRGYENFPQGCAFSPDGLCVLTSTAGDSQLRLYNTPPPPEEGCPDDQQNAAIPDLTTPWQAALISQGTDTVRSYEWYPTMASNNPTSCCFLATCRDQPIHLYDAYTGVVRATYRPYNALDELESPTVLSFCPNGQRIVAGGFRTDRVLHVFDTAIPGRESTTLRLGKTRRSRDGAKGLVSALAWGGDSGNGRLLCVGTYAPGSIYVYDDRTGTTPSGAILDGVCVVGHGRSHSKKKRRFAVVQNENSDEDNEDSKTWLSAARVKWFQQRAQGGVTQLAFAPHNHNYTLYSTSRRGNAVLVWDLRMLSSQPDYQSTPVRGLGSFATDNQTNQRIEFALDESGQTIFVGGIKRCVRIYDVASGDCTGTVDGLDDVANGVSFTNSSRGGLLAIATGCRRFPSEEDFDNDTSITDGTGDAKPGFLRVYRIPKPADLEDEALTEKSEQLDDGSI